MKKSLFILAVILVLNQNVFGQSTEKKFTIQAGSLLWFTDVFTAETGDFLFAMDLEGQYKITHNINVSLTLSSLLNNHTVTPGFNQSASYKENIYKIGLKPMFIYRPFNTGLKGFYFGFYPNFGLLHIKNPHNNQFFAELGLGIDLGYKWVLENGFTMQVGCGISKTFSNPKGSRLYMPVNFNGNIPPTYADIHILDFKMGYSF